MFVLEQALVAIALVGALGVAYRLITGPSTGHSCQSGGECGCERKESAPALTKISRRPKA